MSDGIFNDPSKYHAECTMVRLSTNAEGVVLIVLGGKQGDGFAVQAPVPVIMGIPALLREVATKIEQQQKSKAGLI